ncbi:hypothetical protein SMICM17S_10399 [Streptomyces microflavus]
MTSSGVQGSSPGRTASSPGAVAAARAGGTAASSRPAAGRLALFLATTVWAPVSSGARRPLSAAGAVIENGVLYLATYGFDWNSPVRSNVFKILGIGLATLFRFWSYRTWVFKALPRQRSVPSRPRPPRPLPQRPLPRRLLAQRRPRAPRSGFWSSGEQAETVEPDPVRN